MTKPSFNIKGETIEFRVKTRGRTIWKDRCELKNKKRIDDIAKILKFKFDIDLSINEKFDKRWFE